MPIVRQSHAVGGAPKEKALKFKKRKLSFDRVLHNNNALKSEWHLGISDYGTDFTFSIVNFNERLTIILIIL